MSNVSELVGRTLTALEVSKSKSSIKFTCTDGTQWRMDHWQDCCEKVSIESIEGDLRDLIGEPLVIAEEVSSPEPDDHEYYDDSHTWTFYKLATVKGHVTIRWLGQSNGYYSESVDFNRLNADGEPERCS